MKKIRNILKENKTLIIVFIFLLVLDLFLIKAGRSKKFSAPSQKSAWGLQSIDTVKYSRDVARQYDKDESFNATIDKQMSLIADTGANYVALGTPYDKEFIPYLKRWVDSARKHNLKIWFRGNFSGWEGWFDYKRIDRNKHKELLQEFILANGELFKDGDIFTSCTECENGGPGDPRTNGDSAGHRQFLIDEYQISRRSFAQVSRNVKSNYFPMNYDVALLVMDKETTKALGGIVVIDHYVATTDILTKTIAALIESSGGKVVLGEFGAPIPDIHGSQSDAQQAAWIDNALAGVSENKDIIGVNYWTAFGGSTRLWKETGEATPAVGILKNYFKPTMVYGRVLNEAGYFIKNAKITSNNHSVTTGANGEFTLIYNNDNAHPPLAVSAPGYAAITVENPKKDESNIISLKKQSENPVFVILKVLHKLLGI